MEGSSILIRILIQMKTTLDPQRVFEQIPAVIWSYFVQPMIVTNGTNSCWKTLVF